MSIGSFLFEGSVPEPITKTANTTTQYPPWYNEYLKGTIAKADAIANSPLATYGGQRIAPLTEDQNNAYQMVRDNVGAAQPLLDQSRSMTANASNPSLDEGVYNSYMSPYISGVVNRIAELGTRNLSENLLPQVRDKFLSAGQFGSSGQGDFTARALRDTNESILGQQAQALQAGQEAAMSNYQTAMGREMTGAGQIGNLAGQQQDIGLRDAAALEAAGQQQQTQAQSNLDLGYQNFVEQRDNPKTNVNWISDILQGANLPSSTTQIATSPAGYVNPSLAQSVLGGASTLAGSGILKARGGRVNACDGGAMRRAMGGGTREPMTRPLMARRPMLPPMPSRGPETINRPIFHAKGGMASMRRIANDVVGRHNVNPRAHANMR